MDSVSSRMQIQEMEDREYRAPVLPERRGPTRVQRSKRGVGSPRATEEQVIKTSKLKLLKERVMNSYQYSKIRANTARLLTIQPRASSPRDIYGTLSQVRYQDLGDKDHPYEALSYSWGPGDPTEVIRVQNDASTVTIPTRDIHAVYQEAKKRLAYKEFRIKKNLYQALQELRDDMEPVTFWVDALCIDQSNLEEKKVQVANMDKIYSRANRVVIWLGTANEHSKKAFKFIDEIMDLDKLNSLVADDASASRVNDWSNFLSLMRRSWFSRRWVIQELALAREASVRCGDDEIHWNDFRDAVSMFALKVDDIRSLFKRSEKFDHDYHAIEEFDALGAKVLVEVIDNIFRTGGNGQANEPVLGLEYLVSTLSTFETSDPRDTIHTLRNIAKETFRPGKTKGRREPPKKPDYKNNLLEVYIDFVKWVERTTGCIDIICRNWALPEREESSGHYPELVELPSWIQQISKSAFGRQGESRGRVNGDSFVGQPGQKSYNASHGVDACIVYGIDQAQAILSGAADMMEKTAARPEEVFMDCLRPANTRQDTGQHFQTPIPSPSANDDAVTNPLKRPREASDIDGKEQTAKYSRAGTPRKTVTEAAQSIVVPPTGPKSPQPPPLQSNESRHGLVTKRQLTKEEMEARQKVIRAAATLRRTIYVDGLHVGTLGWATDPIPDGVIPLRVLKTLAESKGSRSKSWEQVASNPPDKLWRTIVAERSADGRNPPAWYQRACQHCLVNDSPNGHINTKELLRQEQPDFLRDFLKRVQAVTWNRVFLEATKSGVGNSTSPDVSDSETSPNEDEEQATAGASQMDEVERNGHDTENARNPINRSQENDTAQTPADGTPTSKDRAEKLHGLGPCEATEGDFVCILFGCSVPCILRRKTDEFGEYYAFIGEAYIYGYMDGEAVMWMSEKKIQSLKTQFNIR